MLPRVKPRIPLGSFAYTDVACPLRLVVRLLLTVSPYTIVLNVSIAQVACAVAVAVVPVEALPDVVSCSNDESPRNVSFVCIWEDEERD